MNGIPVPENSVIFYTLVVLLYVIILLRAGGITGASPDSITG